MVGDEGGKTALLTLPEKTDDDDDNDNRHGYDSDFDWWYAGYGFTLLLLLPPLLIVLCVRACVLRSLSHAQRPIFVLVSFSFPARNQEVGRPAAD